MSSGSEKKRVQFRAPSGLVDRADALATVLETDRTDILISALREYLRDAAHSDDVKQEIADAFYADEIAFEELKSLVGHEEAANFRLLKQQLSEEFVEETTEELADL
jgi:predicted transcriptional regulator